MRSIAIASGKGGVGKTSITVNLGLALAALGKRVVAVDGDVSMANLGLTLGIDRAPISIQNVLSGEVGVGEAVYEGPGGLRYVPASLSDKSHADGRKLKAAVAELEQSADFILVDNPSGLGIDSDSALKSCKEVLLVCTPEPASLADCLKVKKAADRAGVKTVGVVCNMSTGDKSEISPADLETVFEARVLAVVPFDAGVRRASARQVPVFISDPRAPFSTAMLVLAGALSGERLPPQRLQQGLLAGLMGFFKRLLHRS